MPSKKTKLGAAEELHRMREEGKRKDKEIAELKRNLDRERERAAAASTAVKLIPRPKGQAGRDYTLQQEMKLRGDSERYNRHYRIVKDGVHQLLPVGKTIRSQDKRRLEKAIVVISETAPYFKRFEGLWPIHDMIAGYLLNMQTRRNRDIRDEKKASGLDPHESDSGSGGEDFEAEPAEVRRPKQSDNPVVEDLDQSDEELREVTPKGSPKKKKVAGNKRKVEDTPVEEPAAKKKKSVKIPEKNPSAEPLNVAGRSRTKPITAPESAGVKTMYGAHKG